MKHFATSDKVNKIVIQTTIIITESSWILQKYVKYSAAILTLSLPNVTAVEFTVHCQTRLQSKFKGTVDGCLFLTVIRDATLCSLFINVKGT